MKWRCKVRGYIVFGIRSMLIMGEKDLKYMELEVSFWKIVLNNKF